LRQALTYPTPAEEVDDADVRTALAAAGLGHLADRLDEEAEWNTLLSGGEQQRVGFARALIHRPDVLVLDEAVSTLEDAEARDLYALLGDRLPQTMVISIGRTAALVALHQRIIDMTGASAASRSVRPAALAPMPA
jgi:putative ATP-binding cassette transporter